MSQRYVRRDLPILIKENTERIKELLKDTQLVKHNARAFQSLPRHLRRRTMSTNVYRIPLHLRRRAESEMRKSAQSGKTGSTPVNIIRPKKIRRKEKRRPNYITRDYQRRQRTYKWLETHIWHAKRMHMVNRWGYRIAWTPISKGRRSVHRATSHLSTVYDKSYMTCLELSGSKEMILELLSSMSQPDALSIGSNTYIKGDREGSICLYYPNKYPYHLIAPVTYHWRQSQSNETDNNNNSQLWIWVHPSASSELYSTLRNQTIQFENVQLKSLECELSRFELTGPKCNQVLEKLLHPIPFQTDKEEPLSHTIWRSLNELRSCSTLPTGTILGLTVLDPRLICHVPPSVAQCVGSIPNPKIPTSLSNKALLDQRQLNQVIVNLGKQKISYSPILDASKRDLMNTIEPMQNIYQRRKNLFLDDKFSSPSILLIQRDGGLTRGYGSGWDIIIPKGWAMAFWIPIVFAGSWPIGYENRDWTLLEQGLPSFPKDYPDTKAYKLYMKSIYTEKIEKYYRTPKSKKPNYLFNQVYYPFSPNWEWVLKLSATEEEQQQVEEDKEEESILNEDEEETEGNQKQKKKLKSEKAISTASPTTTSIEEKIEYNQPVQYFVYRGKLALSLVESKPIYKNSKYDTKTVNLPDAHGLVRVSIKMYSGGVPAQHSIIYMPNQRDLDLHKKFDYFKNPPNGPVTIEYTCKSAPVNAIDYQNHSTRKPIGYIVAGSQSIARGIGSGIGYCSAVDYVNLLTTTKSQSISPLGLAFIQNPTSKCLYPVILTIQP